MSKLLSLLLVILVFATTIITAQVIEYQNCTDTIFCRQETCSTANLNSGLCMDITKKASNPVSQQLYCNPELGACLELFYYSDSHCTVPLGSIAQVCNACGGDGKKLECFSQNGKETIVVKQCSDAFTCQKNCTTTVTVPKDVCVANGNSGNYAMYGGAVLCTTVDQVLWGNRNCQGDYTFIKQLPAQHCIDGMNLDCLYGSGKNIHKKSPRFFKN